MFCVQYFFVFKSCPLRENVEKYCRVGQTTMTVWRMRIACWIPKSTNTHTQAVQHSLLSHYNNGCTSAPQCCVIRTLPVLLHLSIRCVRYNNK